MRKKDGGPDQKYYELTETIAKFEPVRAWLVKNAKKVRRPVMRNLRVDQKFLLGW